jgi:hypothetical protein
MVESCSATIVSPSALNESCYHFRLDLSSRKLLFLLRRARWTVDSHGWSSWDALSPYDWRPHSSLLSTSLLPGLRRNSAYPSGSHLFRYRLPKWLFGPPLTMSELSSSESDRIPSLPVPEVAQSSPSCTRVLVCISVLPYPRRAKPCTVLGSCGNRSYRHRICASPCRDWPCRWRQCRLIRRRPRHRSSVDPRRSRTCRRRSKRCHFWGVQRLA